MRMRLSLVFMVPFPLAYDKTIIRLLPTPTRISSGLHSQAQQTANASSFSTNIAATPNRVTCFETPARCLLSVQRICQEKQTEPDRQSPSRRVTRDVVQVAAVVVAVPREPGQCPMWTSPPSLTFRSVSASG